MHRIFGDVAATFAKSAGKFACVTSRSELGFEKSICPPLRPVQRWDSTYASKEARYVQEGRNQSRRGVDLVLLDAHSCSTLAERRTNAARGQAGASAPNRGRSHWR